MTMPQIEIFWKPSWIPLASSRSFRDAQEFLNQLEYDTNGIGCFLLDIRIPGMSGMELQQELISRAVEFPIVFITGHGETETAVQAMKDGAFDYIEKPINNQRLLDIVNKAIAHCKETTKTRTSRDDVRRLLETLTPRAVDVLEQIIDGQLNKQIAHNLDISLRTVEVHRARVMDKMQADSVAALTKKVLTAREN
jgi:FixJ family two-component response regulator